MCVAIAKPCGVKRPNRDILKICFKNNPDGAGFAYCRNGKNYIHKGFFTFSDFWKAFENADIKTHESALIHFRVATHGNIDKHTCHPFIITDNYEDMKKTNIVTENGDIMIHNGMLNFELDNENVSDSMFLAKELSKYDLNDKRNQYIFNLALLNNNKQKMNRVAILRINNTIETYGFKEPWENVDGCFFSNKSYKIDFSRTSYYTVCHLTEVEKQEKLNYDEDEIQSKKIHFCHNHSFGKCNELGIYAIYKNNKEYELYCDDCVNEIDYFNCKYCGHTCYIDNNSIVEHICKDCFSNNSEFIMGTLCEFCGNEGKHLLNDTYDNTSKTIVLCDKCFNGEHPFKCSECNKYYSDFNQSTIKNLCLDCYKKQSYGKECVYCKSKFNLMKTNFSTICESCFKEKKGKICYICEKIYLYGDDHIDNFDFCPSCFKKTAYNENILDNFKSYKLLNEKTKKILYDMFSKCRDEKKKEIIELYKYNNYFHKMNENANLVYNILAKEVK